MSKNQQPEFILQRDFVYYLRLQYPDIVFTSMPTTLGSALQGLPQLSKIKVWQKVKAAGYLPGVPDLFIAEVRQGFGGLWIEFKAKGKKAEPHQIAIHEKLLARGYYVRVIDNFEAAVDLLKVYLTKK